MEFSHFDKQGNAVMVDVTAKDDTQRTARATGTIVVSQEVYEKIKEGSMAKGDVLNVARTAGIMAAKNTFQLIPMCHLLMLTGCGIEFTMQEEEQRYSISGICTVRTTGKTGVEMEALTGIMTALLTIYDMCKSVDKTMEIYEVCLCSKSGGKSGDVVYRTVDGE